MPGFDEFDDFGQQIGELRDEKDGRNFNVGLSWAIKTVNHSTGNEVRRRWVFGVDSMWTQIVLFDLFGSYGR